MNQRIRQDERLSVLNSEEVHIAHKHPALGYKNRKDLDPQECVAAYYPLSLADKIIPFLSRADRSKAFTQSQYHRPRLSIASVQHDEPSTPTTSPQRQDPTSNSHPVEMRENAQESDAYVAQVCIDLNSRRRSLSRSRSNLDMTSARTLLLLRAESDLTNSPMHKRPKPQRAPRQHLVLFDPSPQMVEGHYPRPTLVLRHDLSTQALRDMFEWARQCTDAGHVVAITGNMVLFRDYARVEELRQVCSTFGLKIFESECNKLLEKWADFGASYRALSKPLASSEIAYDSSTDFDTSFSSGITLVATPKDARFQYMSENELGSDA